MSENPRPSRIPMLLSAFVFPGSGQFAQRRPVAGAVFAVTFALCLLSFAAAVVRIMGAFYALASSGDLPEEADPSATWMLVSLAVALAVYVAGLIDTWRGYMRAWRAGVREPYPPA